VRPKPNNATWPTRSRREGEIAIVVTDADGPDEYHRAALTTGMAGLEDGLTEQHGRVTKERIVNEDWGEE
jgi:hypothetical protein